MKATDLMVGDWVYCFDPDEPDDKQIYKVSAIRSEYNEGAIKFEQFSDWFEDGWFAPIPLTAGILAKNGIEGRPDFILAISFVKNRKYATPLFNTVHELQHALRLCGMNDLADNFKI